MDNSLVQTVYLLGHRENNIYKYINLYLSQQCSYLHNGDSSLCSLLFVIKMFASKIFRNKQQKCSPDLWTVLRKVLKFFCNFSKLSEIFRKLHLKLMFLYWSSVSILLLQRYEILLLIFNPILHFFGALINASETLVWTLKEKPPIHVHVSL